MTYKELVNSVLDRLREDRVNTAIENNYSKLVGSFVNDAKRVVEDAWSWSVLLRSVNVPITANTTASYDLEDYTTVEASDQLNERARLYIDADSGLPLVRVTTTGREREIAVVTQSFTSSLSKCKQTVVNLGKYSLYCFRVSRPSRSAVSSPNR